MTEYDMQDLSSSSEESVDSWAARVKDPETPPQDGRSYIRLNVTDGYDYERTIYKHGEDMLWPELQAYSSKYSLWTPEALNLSIRGNVINPFRPIQDMYIHNGDVLQIAHSTAYMFDKVARKKMAYLALQDVNNVPYDDIIGPLTREDESILRLNFERFWPHLPPVHIKCRARDTSTVDELILIVAGMVNVPFNQIRILHEGVRITGELGQYRYHDKIDLDVHLEQLGGGTVQKYPAALMQKKPYATPVGMEHITIKMEGYTVEVDSADTHPFSHVLDFLKDQLGHQLRLKYKQAPIDPQLSIQDLVMREYLSENDDMLFEAETMEKSYEVPMTDQEPQEMYLLVLPVFIEGTTSVKPRVIPYGATILNWWSVVQGTSIPRPPAVRLDSVLIRGDPTFAKLALDVDHVLEVDPTPKHQAVARANPNRSDGYRKEEFEGDENSELPGYVNIKFVCKGKTFLVQLLPTTPFRVLSNFIYREFGLSLKLKHEGRILHDDECPQDRRMYQTVQVTASLVHSTLDYVDDLPRNICLVATNFRPTETGTSVYGIMVPKKATIVRGWTRECGGLAVDHPRFYMDGDRIPDNSTYADLDLEDDAWIDVAPEMVGGGPVAGVKRPTPDEDTKAEAPTSSNESDGLLSSANPHFMFENPSASTSTETGPTYQVPINPGLNYQIPATAIRMEGSVKHPAPKPFEGPGVDTFFKKYEAWCNASNLSIKKRFEGLYLHLCDKKPNDILSFAQALPEWDNEDYEGVKNELLQAFYEPEEDRYTLADLNAFVNTPRSINSRQDLNQFIIGFKEIANVLIKHDRISTETHKDAFLKGLGRTVRELMRRRDAERKTMRTNPTFAEIEADARSAFLAETFYERYEYHADQEQDRERNPSHIRVPQLSLGRPVPKDRTDTDIRDITEAVKSLTINMARYVDGQVSSTRPYNQGGYSQNSTYQSRNNQAHHIQVQPWHRDPNTPAITGNPPPPPPQRPIATGANLAGPPRTPYMGDPSRQATAGGGVGFQSMPSGMTCHYCGDTRHGKRECVDYKNHAAQGVFLEGADGRMTDRDGRKLLWRPGQMREQALLRFHEWEARKEVPSSNHYEMVFEDDPQEDEEDWPETCHCCDTFHANNVIAEVNEKRKERDEEPTAAQRSTRTKTKHTVPETPNDPVMDTDEDELAEVVESIVKDTKKRRHPTHQVMSQVEEEFNLNGMATNLLEQGKIQLTIAQACSLNKDLAREVSKRIKPRRVPIIGPIAQNSELVEKATVHFSNNAQVIENGPFYTHGLPLLKVNMGDETLKALLDGGSELDMISLEAAKRIAADVRNDGNHKVFGIGTLPVKLSGVLENARITIGGITKTVHLWVRPGLNYDMLLGMPTIARFNLRQERSKDGLVWVRLKDDSGRKVKMLAVQANHPKNRTFLPPRMGTQARKEDTSSEDSDSSDD
ncbi:hypothetical protein A4X13_0g7192 [Tilletia indica]|uniref:Ubiquitin-like domain-containing protein n=1 Tax=Tilletia indica TaxID=43049 RepID=A0A8T8SKD0_9BASI|nr:hypothetical protein A4X13_0g7192 [Tilletia indica]